jgi:phospholipid transport system substrate-binding protein
MKRRIFGIFLANIALLLAAPSQAQSLEAPDAFIKRLSVDVLERMTAAAVGRAWRSATPEQQTRLLAEFKALLMRTYSGALSEVRDQAIHIKPLRMAEGDAEVTVRTEIKGRGDPIALDYRLEKAGASWKIYDLNVASIWLVETYRTQFSQEINANGLDGLIAKLSERNKGRK